MQCLYLYPWTFSPLHLLQDVVQQNNTLIEEMLYLIIMLVGKYGLFVTFINYIGFCDNK